MNNSLHGEPDGLVPLHFSITFCFSSLDYNFLRPIMLLSLAGNEKFFGRPLIIIHVFFFLLPSYLTTTSVATTKGTTEKLMTQSNKFEALLGGKMNCSRGSVREYR